MPLDFPNAPILGQTYTSSDGSTEWVFDGVKWTNGGGAGSDVWLPLSGGTISPGPLTINKTNANGVTISPIGMYDTPPSANEFSQLSSVVNVGTSGGGLNLGTTTAGQFYTTVYGAPNNFCWGLSSVVSFNGTGGQGQNVAGALYAVRSTAAVQPTTTVAVTLGSPSYTVQVADVTNFQLNYAVPVLINGHAYMQTAVSGASGAGTISLSQQVTVADGTIGNTVTGCANPSMFGANIYYKDTTGLDSQHTSFGVGMELDLFCNGLDNGGQSVYGSAGGLRTILNLVGVKQDPAGADAEIGDAVQVTTADGFVVFKRILHIEAPFNQSAFDTRGAVQETGANAIWLNDGHNIAFDAAADVTMSGAAGQGATISGGRALTLNAVGGWSGANLGRQLLVTCPSNTCHPAIGLTDATGANLWSVSNQSGTLFFGSMPAYSDTTSSPTWAMRVTSTGINSTAIGATTPSTGAFTNIAASGTVSGAGFTSLFASPPAIGGTTAAAGQFTTLGATGQITGTQSGGGSGAAIVVSNSTTPAFGWNDSGQGTDAKNWDAISVFGTLTFRAVNDANSGASNWLAVTRSGYVPQAITLTAPAIVTSGALTVSASGGPTIRAGTGAATGTQPAGSLWLRTDGASGSRLYVSAGGGTWAAVAGV